MKEDIRPEAKYTRHQVPRGSRPDAEVPDRVFLIKNVSTLRATYQVRLLAFKAIQSYKKLVIKVPRTCQFHPSLKNLMKEAGSKIKREDV